MSRRGQVAVVIAVFAALAALPCVALGSAADGNVKPIRITCFYEGKPVAPPPAVTFILPDGRRFGASVHDGLFEIPPPALADDVTMEVVIHGARARFDKMGLAEMAPRGSEAAEWRIGFLRPPYDKEHAYAVPKDPGIAAIWYIDFVSSMYEGTGWIYPLRSTDPDFPKEPARRDVELICLLNQKEIPPPDRIVFRTAEGTFTAPVRGGTFAIPEEVKRAGKVGISMELAGRNVAFGTDGVRSSGPKWRIRILTAPFSREDERMVKCRPGAVEAWEFEGAYGGDDTVTAGFLSADGKVVPNTCEGR